MLRGLILIMFVLAAPVVARADAPLEHVEPSVPRRLYLDLVDRLALDDDARMIADLLYSDYAVSLEDLGKRIETRAEEAGRQRVSDALSGRIFIDREELQRLRVAVMRSYEEGWPTADRLLQELVDNVISLVADDSVDVEGASHDLRRAVYLSPRLARRQDESYAGDGVDVGILFAEAGAEGAELERLDPGRVTEILDGWERAMDTHLVAVATADRRGRQSLTVARIERDADAQEREERAALARWEPAYRLNRDAVEAIAAIAGESVGAEAARAWRARFDRACFPRLFRSAKFEREHTWIARHVKDAGARSSADAVLRDAQQQRDDLCRAAIEIMLEGRLERHALVHPRMDASRLRDERTRRLYQDLLKNSGRRASLDSDTCIALEGLVTERQRKQMLSDIAAAAYGRRR
ncbi:MAG: hypothetical protein GY715_17000 [Planctomycetes bacterium]|nr:hypothetical protein [Planctomycetota bacterium]